MEGTPFYGRFAHSSLDYVVAWLLLAEVINRSFHPVPATGDQHGRLGNVAQCSERLQRCVPPLGRWGGCTLEQIPLEALGALSHPVGQGGSDFDLSRHIESVHRGIKYPCDECSIQCSFPSALRIHKRRKHKKEDEINVKN